MSIIPIPTTRAGDYFVRQRLVDQVQSDQLALFRLQNQISTGRRIILPSEDAPAALRATNLQRMLDRKGQIRTNLESSNSYLSAAESSLGSISQELIELRGAVVGVAGTVTPQSERSGLAREIDGLLQELVALGNGKSQGRYLFAGSQSQTQPFDFDGEFVKYSGNEGVLRSYVDLERLFETNLSGTDVFGGISAAVEGSVDLDPLVTADTLVSTINGGRGIGRNPAISISVNTGTATETRIIDLSSAVTLGHVAKLIEAGAPTTDVTVEVTGTGFVLRAGTDTDTNTISVSEVAQGHTARELGILSDPDALATDPLIGDDLNAAVLKTTRLTHLLDGALDTTSGFILTNGGESVTLDISEAETVEDLLNQINGAGLGLVAEINADATGINVRSRLSGADFTIGENGGTTATQLGIRTYTGETKLSALNRGIGVPTSETADDLVIVARNTTPLSIDLSGATTVNHVIDRINAAASSAGLAISAQLAETGNGIALVDATIGAGTLTVQTVEGSVAAQYLGFVADGQTQSDSADVQNVGLNQVLQSQDRNTLEADSVFNTLLRLQTALEEGDTEEIGRSLERLDEDLSRVNLARAEIGGRIQNLQSIGIRLQDENVQLQSSLSQEIDVDLVEAISNLTARQYAFEASLRTAGSIMQLSLLNFL